MQKKWLVVSDQWLGKKQFQSFVQTVHCSLNTVHSEHGVGQLALVMLMLVGLAVGTYVVQNRTSFIPHADDDVRAGYCESKYVYQGGDAGDNANWSPINESSCEEYYKHHSDENSYLCGKSGGTWQDDHCATGTPSNNQSGDQKETCSYEETCSADGKEGVHACTGTPQDGVCKYDPDVNPNCGSCSVRTSSDENEARGGTTAPGNQSSGNTGQYDQGDCRDGAQTYKDGYTWIAYCDQVCRQNSDCAQNTIDGAVNPATSNWCYGFNNGQAPRCMKLVQSDNREVNNETRKSKNSQAVQVIKSNLASGANPNESTNDREPKQSSSADLRTRIDAQNKQRGGLVTELATISNLGANSSLSGLISRAQSAIQTAASAATACYTGRDKPLSDECDAQAQAANDIAVAAGRVALFDAVMAGIPNTCVKVDMAVGSNTSNSQIEVNPAGSSTPSRLFMCRGAESRVGSRDGDIKWRVRDDAGKLGLVSPESLSRLGLREGSEASIVLQDFVNRRNNAATLASQTAYSSANTNSNTTNTSTTSNESVNNCRTDTFCREQRGTGSSCGTDSRCTPPTTQAAKQGCSIDADCNNLKLSGVPYVCIDDTTAGATGKICVPPKALTP